MQGNRFGVRCKRTYCASTVGGARFVFCEGCEEHPYEWYTLCGVHAKNKEAMSALMAHERSCKQRQASRSDAMIITFSGESRGGEKRPKRGG